MPTATAHVITDFDGRRTGFKGAAFRSRGTNLILTTCGTALKDSGLEINDTNRDRIGAVIASGEGSLNAAGSYTRVTLTDPRPEHGSPALFPSTVMNHAAAQSAIHYRLSGPNTTIASSRMALLRVLRYSATLLRRGYADALLAGVVEEFTPYSAWLTHLAEPSGRRGVPPGEGATVLTVETTQRAQAAGRHIDAELLAVTTGFATEPAARTRELSACVSKVLSQADLDASRLARIITDDEALASGLDTDALGTPPVQTWHTAGECRAASGGLLLAALLALHREDPDRDGEHSLLLGADRDGGVGAALFRCWSRPAATTNGAS
ncbi:beta-ketoacyl synthase N-terminal-like domain-containing protein [Streptomyces sp. 8N616]|uniref:beta-ketoacyl synthase N-terminal-like domain-containing protein n=1 Tax=Streptomyces sp. 8N616 TaxID=3457414 RepID=UPI003FD00740